MLDPFDPTPIKAPPVTKPPVQEAPADAATDAPDLTDGEGSAPESTPAEPAAAVDDDEVFEADEVLMAATDQAKAALELVTPADTIGEYLGYIVEGEHVLSLLFDCLMTGYPGWRWTVSLSRVDGDSEPRVLETELMPGDDALLAPEWVPWSDRLADSKAAEELVAAVLAGHVEGDDDDTDDDDTDDDESDEDESDEDDDTDGEDGDDNDDDESDDEDESAESDDAADDGVDVLDGIDFDEALTASELNEGETGQAEAETDDGAPQPPAQARGMQFSSENDRQHERD